MHIPQLRYDCKCNKELVDNRQCYVLFSNNSELSNIGQFPSVFEKHHQLRKWSILFTACPNVFQRCSIALQSGDINGYTVLVMSCFWKRRWISWHDEAWHYILDREVILEMLPSSWQLCILQNVPVPHSIYVCVWGDQCDLAPLWIWAHAACQSSQKLSKSCFTMISPLAVSSPDTVYWLISCNNQLSVV